MRLTGALAGAATVALVALGLTAALFPAERSPAPELRYGGAMQKTMAPSSPDAVASSVAERTPAPPAPTPVGARQNGDYQGLPARIELPQGERQTHLARELLAGDTPRRVSVVLASTRLVAALAWAAALLALAVAALLRRDLARGVRAYATRLLARSAPAAETPGITP